VTRSLFVPSSSSGQHTSSEIFFSLRPGRSLFCAFLSSSAEMHLARRRRSLRNSRPMTRPSPQAPDSPSARVFYLCALFTPFGVPCYKRNPQLLFSQRVVFLFLPTTFLSRPVLAVEALRFSRSFVKSRGPVLTFPRATSSSVLACVPFFCL